MRVSSVSSFRIEQGGRSTGSLPVPGLPFVPVRVSAAKLTDTPADWTNIRTIYMKFGQGPALRHAAVRDSGGRIERAWQIGCLYPTRSQHSSREDQ